MLIELFIRIKYYDIKDVIYNNFRDRFNIWTFSDNFEEYDSYDTCNNLRELLHNCISEDKKVRPTLETLLNFYNENIF